VKGARPLLLLIAVAVAPGDLRGQDTRTVPAKYGHVFVDAPLSQSPFVRTSVLNSIGVGRALNLNFGTVILPDGDTLLALDGDLTVATLEFEYAHALRDWLGVWGDFRMGARVGTDAGALVASGVTLATTFEFGWLAQLRETDRSLLSSSFFVGNRSVTLVDVGSWIEGAVSGTGSDLVQTTPGVRVGVGLHYAWVLNQVVAFSGSGWGAYGEALDDQGDNVYYNGALSTSINLETKYGVPLGLSLTLRADSDPTLSGALSGGWQSVGLLFAYTGREDMMLGFGMRGERVPFDEERRMNVVQVGFDLRYYF